MKDRYFLFSLCLAAACTLMGCSEIYDNSWTTGTAGKNLDVSRRQFSFDSDAQSQSFGVTSDGVAWSVSNSASWLSFTPSSGTATADVTISVTENKSDTARVAYPSVEAADARLADAFVLTVTQKASEPFINIGEQTVVLDGGIATKVVSVVSNYALDYSATENWISLEPLREGVRISVTENPGAADRTADIIVRAGSLTKSISVIQRSANVTATVEQLTFTPSAATQQMTIEAGAGWNATASMSWIDVSPSSGDAGTTVLSVSVTANTDISQRMGYVYVSVGQTVKLEIPVMQEGTNLSLSPASLLLDSHGSARMLTVSASIPWELMASEAWIHIDKTKGDSGTQVTVTADENKGKTPRSGSIVLKDSAGKECAVVSVEQEGKDDDADDVYDFGYTFLSKGGSLEVYPIDNADWTAEIVSGESWISISPASGNKDKSMVITVSDNASGDGRSGYIRITYGQHSYLCPIVQAGKTMEVSTRTVDFFAKGGMSPTIIVTADKSPKVTTSASWLKVSQNGSSFTLTAGKNSSANLRMADVTVTLPGVDNSPVERISVRQAGVDGTFSLEEFGGDENWN